MTRFSDGGEEVCLKDGMVRAESLGYLPCPHRQRPPKAPWPQKWKIAWPSLAKTQRNGQVILLKRQIFKNTSSAVAIDLSAPFWTFHVFSFISVCQVLLLPSLLFRTSGAEMFFQSLWVHIMQLSSQCSQSAILWAMATLRGTPSPSSKDSHQNCYT